MPFNFNIDLSQRRKERQALDMLEKQRQAQQELVNSMLPNVPMATMGGGIDFGARPAISPEQAQALMMLSPENAAAGSLELLEQQRKQQQAQQQQAKLQQALTSPALQATPELQAITSLVGAGASPDQLGAFKDQLQPFTLGVDQQRFTGTGGTIAIGPEKAADLEAKRKEDWADATGLRKEFTAITKPFDEQNQAYGRIIVSAQDPSAAGDLALIFNYMKVLDPGSTVREGEFATAQNAAGVPERVSAFYNNIMRGERMTPVQRKDFVDRAGKLFGQAAKQHKKTSDEFRALAKRRQVDPENVVFGRQTVDIPKAPPPPPGFK